MLKLTWNKAAAWRLRAQHLDHRAPPESLLAVANRLCGLHAQVMSSAELTAWARVEGLKRGEVQQALWQQRSLIKMWAMRGTLHLLPARELPLWHAGLGTSRRYLKPAHWKNYFGITLKQLDRLSDAVAAALDGRVMTREELAAEVGRTTGSRALAAKLGEGSWGTILKPAAFSGRLCFGPNLGQRVRFTRPDTWTGGLAERVAPEAATAEITRRFFAANGPATAHDLARWWTGGAGVGTARQWIAALGDELAPVALDGVPAWMLAADARAIRQLPPLRSVVRLLPAFDQYVVAASCHAGCLLPDDRLRGRVYRPQGWLSPVLLVNGRMAGIWRHQLKRSNVAVTIEPFDGPQPAWVKRGAVGEAERLAEFLGGRLELTWQR
jgi:hypothetical protein